MPSVRNALVVGGGIAGMTLGTALLRRGIRAEVVEINPAWSVLGIGISVQGATLRALEHALAGRTVDLVLSDMSPNISGIAVSDQARAMHLAELALEFAMKQLQPAGALLVKVFQGEGFDGFVKAMRGVFVQVRTHKPDASRKGSREVYLLGRGLKAVATN